MLVEFVKSGGLDVPGRGLIVRLTFLSDFGDLDKLI
jgi:hypothetical protein